MLFSKKSKKILLVTRRKTETSLKKVTKRGLFLEERKSGLEKSTKKKRSRHQFLDIDERDDALVVYIYIETRPTLLKHLHAHHHHHRRRHVVENTTTNNNNDDEKETKNARRVPTLHADEPAVGSVPHRAIPVIRFSVETRKRPRTDLPSRWGMNACGKNDETTGNKSVQLVRHEKPRTGVRVYRRRRGRRKASSGEMCKATWSWSKKTRK